ncbi:uncharacterized protein LOC116178354 [Photinus pyralis]|uniref:uncharacterized protein LOC116178354 n=1 Tax=Photinus pyralis TaxID=7054 RepID=UPI001266EBEF|nr:uncharacterized protein LOC116178354 [Photinus pyralis]
MEIGYKSGHPFGWFVESRLENAWTPFDGCVPKSAYVFPENGRCLNNILDRDVFSGIGCATHHPAGPRFHVSKVSNGKKDNIRVSIGLDHVGSVYVYSVQETCVRSSCMVRRYLRRANCRYDRSRDVHCCRDGHRRDCPSPELPVAGFKSPG